MDHNDIERRIDDLRREIDSLRREANGKKMDEIRATAERKFDDAKLQAEEYISSNPIKATVAAMGIGFLLACALTSRKKRSR